MQSLTERATAEQELGPRGSGKLGASGAESSSPSVYKLLLHLDPVCVPHRANCRELLAGVLRGWKVGEKARIAPSLSLRRDSQVEEAERGTKKHANDRKQSNRVAPGTEAAKMNSIWGLLR